MSLLKNILPITLCVFSYTLDAHAANENQSEWNFQLGGGLVADSRPWTGTDTETSVLPFFEASIGNWHFGFENLVAYQVEESAWPGFYIGVGLRDDGYSSTDFAINDVPDSNILKDYDELETETVINYGTSFGWLAIDASTDVSNNSESNTLGLTVEIPVYESSTGFSISTSLSANWMDSNYVNYYYGISGSQIDNSVGRTKYQANSATNYGIAIEATYPVNDQWVVVGALSHTVLADEISESPLIDTDSQNSMALLAIYLF